MGKEITGPKKSISAAVGAGSEYQKRNLKWSGWRKGKATGRGKVRYCSDSCSSWKAARIVLDRRRGRTCGDAPAGSAPTVYYYTRFRLYGFEFIDDDDAISAPHPC